MTEIDHMKALATDARKDSYRNHRVACVTDLLAVPREDRAHADCWVSANARPPAKAAGKGRPPVQVTEEQWAEVVNSDESAKVLSKRFGVPVYLILAYRRDRGA